MQAPRMKCGWGCGAQLTASRMRPHFTACPERRVASDDDRRGTASAVRLAMRGSGSRPAARNAEGLANRPHPYPLAGLRRLILGHASAREEQDHYESSHIQRYGHDSPWGLADASAFERSRRAADACACLFVEAFFSTRLRSRFRRGNLLSDAPYLEWLTKEPSS
jgi:hypothetical protein